MELQLFTVLLEDLFARVLASGKTIITRDEKMSGPKVLATLRAIERHEDVLDHLAKASLHQELMSEKGGYLAQQYRYAIQHD